MELFFNKKLVGSLPIKPLADSSPEYNRPSKKQKKQIKQVKKNLPSKINLKNILIKIFVRA